MFKDVKRIYMIGIGGVSMSALAQMLQHEGFEIKGSDVTLSGVTEKLQEKGIEINEGNCPSFVCWADVCIFTAAVREDNPDLVLAEKLNKKIYSRADVLGYFSRKKKCISVAGTHGKTTTTGMLATVMLSAGLDPSIHIGGRLNEFNSNVYVGEGEYLVTEACEYKDSFLTLSNDISVVLNVEKDHMDYFKNEDNLVKSFRKFIKNTKKDGFCVVNGCILAKMGKNSVQTICFGENPIAKVRAEKLRFWAPGRYAYDLYIEDDFVCEIKLSAFGKHNVTNSLAVVAVSLLLGIDIKTIQDGLIAYKGVERRMQLIKDGSPIIIHDYAHHPTEILSTLETCKEIGKRVLCIFQPHTFSRTRDLYAEFMECFNHADEVWLLPIYPAREQKIKGISSYNFFKDMSEKGLKTKYFSTFYECKNEIIKINDFDVVAILGAGDIEKLAKML